MRGRKYAWGKPDERKMRAETQKIDWSYCYNSIKDTILSVFRNSWPEIVSGELSDLLYLGSNSFWSKSGTLKALYLLHFSLIRRPTSFSEKGVTLPNQRRGKQQTRLFGWPGVQMDFSPLNIGFIYRCPFQSQDEYDDNLEANCWQGWYPIVI